MLDKSIFIDDKAWKKEWEIRFKAKSKLQFCKKCLYDEEVPGIKYNSDGICNYCENQNELEEQFYFNGNGYSKLEEIAENIKKENRNKKYDIIVGVSGGCDSSYLLHLAKDLNMRVLAVHFDNTWNSNIATQNIYKVLDKLDYELWTYVINNNEMEDLHRSFLRSGTADLEIPTDIGLAATLNMAAEKYNINYVFEGHSFRTEGLAPIGWIYMDARYIKNVHSIYGEGKMKTFPNFSLSRQMKWMLFNKIKKIRPLWYIPYNKENVKKMLQEKYDWVWYGGHHLENRMTEFYHSYYFPRRFSNDFRVVGHSACVRSGLMSREEAFDDLRRPPEIDMDLVEMIRNRLNMKEEEFLDALTQPILTYKDFKTYKKTFEHMRPFFYLMAKAELIPWSFYIKYTSKNNI